MCIRDSLYSVQTLQESEILKQKCLNLQNVLQDEGKLGECDIDGNHVLRSLHTVSYTHLDVYKRQG